MANPFTDPFNTFGYSVFAGTPGMAGSPNPSGASTPSNSTTDLPANTTTDPNFSNTGINSTGGSQIPGTPSIFSYNGSNTLSGSGVSQTNAFNPSTWSSSTVNPTWNGGTATNTGATTSTPTTPTLPSGGTGASTGSGATGGTQSTLSSPPPATLFINGAMQTNPAYVQWLTQNQIAQSSQPGSSVPTSGTQTTLSGAFSPLANPTFGTGTGTGPTDQQPGSPTFGQPITTQYNPSLFASQSTAQQIAQQLGGSVVSGDPLGFSQGSPFSAPSANMIQLPNGRVIDAGTIAQYEQVYGNSPNMLQALINSEITGQGQNPQSFQNTLAGYNPAAVAASQPPNPTPQQLAGSTPPGVAVPNPGTYFGYNPNAANMLNGQPQPTLPAGAGTLSGSGQQLQAPPLNPQAPAGNSLASLLSNPTQLNSLLQFLQAYSGLGSGGGNPTGINPAGQIGQASVTSPTDLTDLMTILMALNGGGSNGSGLYNRSGYSQFA